MRRIPLTWVAVAAVLLVVVLITLRMPPQYSYVRTYKTSSTAPYASRSVFEYLTRVSGSSRINTDRLAHAMQVGRRETWLFVTDKFEPDSASLVRLCSALRNGMQVVLVAHSFSTSVRDSFNLIIGPNTSSTVYESRNDSWHEVYGSDSIDSYSSIDGDYFLGTWESFLEDEDDVVLAAVRPFGRGRLVVSTIPDAFTNVALVQLYLDELPQAIFSRMESRPLVWDQHYIPLSIENTAFLAVLNSWPGMHYAYWTLIFTGLGAVLVHARRKQRAIPVLPTHQNSIVAFVDQISMIYWNRKAHGAVARQLLRQFRQHCVHRYRLNASQLHVDHAEDLHRISGCPLLVVERILVMVDAVGPTTTITEAQLKDLHHNIALFFSFSPP
ncbi:MAG TPA: hypothetical protein VK147_01565 [Candidatus Didemnitutus sp.]|nr:hypothetical protein [Candidatus Didemnitutus sp.]